MTPEAYAGKYTNLTAMLYDGTLVRVQVDRYLSAKHAWDKDPEIRAKASKRATNGIAAYFKLYAKIKKELKKVPATFLIDGIGFKLAGILYPHEGKGSPAEVREILWLGSRYGLVTEKNAVQYVQDYTGLDCNGFVGNYWGLNPNTEMSGYDVSPRKKFSEIKPGDAIVFYYGTRDKKVDSHVAAIEKVLTSVLPADDAKKTFEMQLRVVDSGGPDLGVHAHDETYSLQKDAAGTIFAMRGKRHAYICGGPAKGTHRDVHRLLPPIGLGKAAFKAAEEFATSTAQGIADFVQ